MDEPVEPVKKKKRKYTKRGPYGITVEGRAFKGTEIRREGKFLVLKTVKGSVMVNTETARTPIEIVGELAVQTPLQAAASVPGGPVASGTAVDFAKRRAANIEGLLKMPDGFDPAE